MQNLIAGIREAVQGRAWHAALALALAMPDICGKIDGPAGNGARYKAWFDKYVKDKYTGALEMGSMVFLSADDCYKLRNAYLHSGEDVITYPLAPNPFTINFQFVVSGKMLHCNKEAFQNQSVLQIDVEQFCEDIVIGVETWLLTKPNVPFDETLKIHHLT